MPRISVCISAVLAVVLLCGVLPAHALDAKLEVVFDKLAKLDSEIDPLTADRDENGIVDKAHVRLLDRVLQEEDAPQHTLILGVYLLNRLEVEEDNTLTNQCTLLQLLYKITCDELEMFIAGIFTIGEPVYVDLMLEQSLELGLEIDIADYDLAMNAYLGADGDLDGDGFTNIEEYESVCGQFDQFVEAAMDPALTPETVPCCGVCVLAVTEHPAGGRKYVGQPHIFSAAATDTEGVVTYEWFRGGESVLISDTGIFDIPSLTLDDDGTYWCVITDATESVTTEEAVLQVADRVSITQDPVSARKLVGDTHQFNVAATGGLGRLRYQWQVDGSPTGGDASVLTLGSLEEQDAGTYLAIVSDGVEAKPSTPATLEVLPRLQIITQPAALRAYAGGRHVLSVGAQFGLGDYRYTWYRSGSQAAEGSAEVVLDPLAPGDSGVWFCRVRDDFDSRDSETATLTIAAPVTVSLQPISGTFFEGDPLMLTVQGQGGFETLSYQWFKGTEPVSRGRQASLTFDALTLNNAGEYFCEVSDGTMTVPSNLAVIVVEVVPVEGEGEGEGEGVAEGEGEGTTEGVAEGEGEGTPEGVLEGEEEGTSEGVVEGILEGEEEGVVEGILEGEGEGLAEGDGEEDGEGAVDGEGETEGLTEGAADGEGEGEGEGEGNTEGSADGEGALEGEGAPEGEPEGELLEIPVSLDTTLYEDPAGSIGNGAGQHLFVGKSGQNLDRRALLFFDTAALPEDAEVLSAAIRFTVSRGDRPLPIQLHRVARDWGEGTSDAPGNEGQGAPAAPMDATWLHALHDSDLWSTPGGDFDALALAFVNVPGLGEFTLGGPLFAALVEAWNSGATPNHGVLLNAPTSGEGGSIRLDSRENPEAANRPVLVVRYIAPLLEGEGIADGEGAEEGSVEGEGEGMAEGEPEGSIEGEGASEGADEGEGEEDGEGEAEGNADGEGEGEGEGAPEGEGEGESIPLEEAVIVLIENLGEYDLDDDLNLNTIDIEVLKPDLTPAEFDLLDTDDDGLVSLRELRVFAGLPVGALSVLDVPEGGFDFGSRPVNVSYTRTITLKNTGTAALSLVLQMGAGIHYSIDAPASLTLAPGASARRVITFRTTATGTHTDQLIIDTTDGAPAVRVDLTGQGASAQVQGCLADPDGPGGVDLQSIFTVGLGLIVLLISFGRAGRSS